MKTKNYLWALLGVVIISLSFECSDAQQVQTGNKKRKGQHQTMQNQTASNTDNSQIQSSGNSREKYMSSPFKGIYVATDWQKPVEEYVLQSPAVDGIFLRLYWDRLQTSENSFDWSYLDPELKRIAKAGKTISIGVAAGSHSPEWIYQAGVPSLNFDEFRKQGKGKRFSIKIPVPYNEKYLQIWTGFITSFATHLKSMPDVYSHISLVKLTGINETTVEIRLPAQKEISNEKGTSTDAPAIWKTAGYTPQRVLNAWNQILNSFYDNFENKYVSIAVIPKRGFPSIDENGNETQKNKAFDFTEKLIDAGYQKFKDRFVVQWNSLQKNSNIPGLMAYVNKYGIAKGYQIAEADLANPDCLEKKSICDQEMFKAVIDWGIANDASFIEIFQKNVAAYQQALTYGKAKMEK